MNGGINRVRTLTPKEELDLVRQASTTFNQLRTAVQSGKPKDEVRHLSRTLAHEVNALVRGYAGGTSKIVNAHSHVSDADKVFNAQQIKKVEDAWKKADAAAKEAKKDIKVKPDALKRLQQETLDAKKAYDTRKGQYIYKGELKTIVRI